jgi:DNA-binding NtrC family response regulator
LTPSVSVLVAEDEVLILNMLQEALEEAGFDVLIAADGAVAVTLLDGRHSELSGLVSDVRLGAGPNGWEVARHARELRPDLSVVYITGDSGVDWAVNGVPKSILVQKPFASAQVITALATLINDASSQSA